MNEKKKYYGTVIKAIDYKENAQIVTLFSEEGLTSLIVRGAKKINSKTRAIAQVLTDLEYVATDNKALNTLIEAQVVDNHNEIKNDFLKMQIAYCMIDKVYQFGSQSTNIKVLYDFFITNLKILRTTSYPAALLAVFEIKLCYLLGIAPNFNGCSKCNKKITSGEFSVHYGGIICDDCSKVTPVQLALQASQVLKYMYLIKMEKIDEIFLGLVQPFVPDIDRCIDEFYAEHYECNNKCKSVYHKIINSL